MNVIRESMREIQASEELKKNTLLYLKEQTSRPRARLAWRYAFAAVCLFLAIGAGGWRLYASPVSYISIDINPSIELGVNRFGRVVSADAYNGDGQEILSQVRLKNMSYAQAVDRLLRSGNCSVYLTEADSQLVFTVISDDSDVMLKEISANELARRYGALIYTSDMSCREEAHRHEMSFGKYRAYLELSQYDETVTVEDCHGMTVGEICDRIESCRQHDGDGSGESHWGNTQEHHWENNQGHHGGHHEEGH